MLLFSHLLKNNLFSQYYCILDEKTKYFNKFFPYYKVLDSVINEEALWSISNIYFMNLDIFFIHLENFYNNYINDQIKFISESINDNNLIILSPLGVSNNLNFINDIDIFETPVTKVLNQNFFYFHKLNCSLPNQKTILITLFLHFSYNIDDLIIFLIKTNYLQNSVNLNRFNLVMHSLEEGLNLLKISGYIQESFFSSKLYEEIKKYQLEKMEKMNLYTTYKNWQSFFQEPPIKYCNCFYVSIKDVNNYTYYHLQMPEPLKFSFNLNSVKKRFLSIELNKPYSIHDYKKFYLENILGFSSSQLLKNNFCKLKNQSIQNIKFQSLTTVTKTNIFSWNF